MPRRQQQQKYLHELLQEDQEPFKLKSYIADRRFQLKRETKTQLQVIKKRSRPITQAASSSFPQNFCKTACFFAYTTSSSTSPAADPRKSPLFELQSPAKKSPCNNPNTIFLHVPARTAALLLDAALRIQKQSSSKTKTANKPTSGFGLFGSFLKRLTHRNKTRHREIANDLNGLKHQQQHSVSRGGVLEEKSASRETGFSYSCTRRTSSAVWSESNEGKSLDFDLDTASSSTCRSDEDFEFADKVMNLNDMVDLSSYDRYFCDSPFRFVLCTSPSSGHRTPDFSSPATSPFRHKTTDQGRENNNDEVQSLKKLQANEAGDEEEEDKEQCSPVSVLDPPFEDDDDIVHDDQSEDDGFDLECSYAIVQRAKQKLLQKLRRFEKLAELDPVELEERMMEQEREFDEEDNNMDCIEREEGCDEEDLASSDMQKSIDMFIMQSLCKSSFNRPRKIPRDMKRLVSDLINEEEQEFGDREATVKRVCKRLESWKNVESNTIDMMVGQDFRRDKEGWRKDQEQAEEVALAIELSIFGILVEELSEELLGLNGQEF
ncbi:hypothetical protein Tsubulata_042106 [Turnera subulata]|uniref:DUF4378 domain-containing protein n=1 Tax=Turnera subulata TaxID=218843 RepID=A0A9Q0FSR5_9ROSI|nr:hypothetical protein Tsubulata_042106 [Turnera subulata]